MDDPLVVPDGVSISPEKLEPLAQVLEACWAEVIAKHPGLDDPQTGPSLRNLIASRILNGAAVGRVDDVQELRRRALDGIL
jgi:hypothetical protein